MTSPHTETAPDSQLTAPLLDAWRQACQSIQLTVPDEQVAQLSLLYEALLAYNAHTNLTRLTSPHDYLYRHVLEALTLLPLIPENASVIDLGSGAGFPAIPLALMRPDCQVTAVESVGKKCLFITQAKELLALDNLTVVQERAEVLGRAPSTREQFDVVTARALAVLPVLLEYAIPLLKTGGCLLAMKGASYQEELEKALSAFQILSARFEAAHIGPIPELTGSVVLEIYKQAATLPKYPRQPGTPAKKPL